MKKVHVRTLKFHTIYSFILAIVFLIVALFVRDAMLMATMFLVLLYIAGNGIMHRRKNQLSRDSVVEYAMVSTIVIVMIIGVIV